MYITRSVGATAVLLAASQSYGFVSTRHHHHRRSNRNSLAPSAVCLELELHHLHMEMAWEERQDAKRYNNNPSGREDAPVAKPGVATQLGGWSYARTLFSDSKRFREEDHDEQESSASRLASTSTDSRQSSAKPSSDSGSTSRSSSRGLKSTVGGGDGEDGDDDDETDAWDSDLDGQADEQSVGKKLAVGGTEHDFRDAEEKEEETSQARKEFEVLCDGDVCERRPVASPGAVQTTVDTPDRRQRQETAAEDARDGATTAGGDSHEEDPSLSQLVSMGWNADESAMALAEAGGNVLTAAEALAAREEEDLERYKEGLAELKEKGWDEDVAMSAMREAGGNATAALLALEEDDRVLSMNFERSIEEMVEHGWNEEVARKALLMQWQKDIENGAGGRKAQKQFEKTVKGVKAQGPKEGTGVKSKDGGKKSDPAPANAPTPVKREDVVFDVTDKDLQKVVMESPVPVILDVYAEWCGPCKQLTPALEEAAMRSGGMFRVAKVDAEKQRVIAEVLGIKAYPSIFGLKEGIIVDNFVGILPQEEMQSFMMSVIMGTPPKNDKPLREHQRGQAELRSLSRKLAHIAGLAVIGSRKKERLCLKVDRALSEMLPSMANSDSAKTAAAAVTSAKRAAKIVITILMSAYKFPEDPKFRRLSTSSTVYTDVLAAHPSMLEVLRLAGFRRKDGDDTYLHLLHRNMAVLASVQDRVELWDKAVKVPVTKNDDAEENDEGEGADEHDEHEDQKDQRRKEAHWAKLQITKAGESGNEGVINLKMAADATLGEVFQALQESKELGDDLVLTTNFPKRELAASDPSCLSSTLLSLGLVPSARLVLTDSATLAAAKAMKEQQNDMDATRKEGLRARMMDKSQEGKREGRQKKRGGTLFGAEDGIIEVKKGKHREYFGGDSTVTIAAEEEGPGDTDSDDSDDTRGAGPREGGEELFFLDVEDESDFEDPKGALKDDSVVDQEEAEACEESGYEYDHDFKYSDGDEDGKYDDLEDYGDEVERCGEPIDVEGLDGTMHGGEDVDMEMNASLGDRDYNDDDDLGGFFKCDSSGNGDDEDSDYYEETEEGGEEEELGKNHR